MKDRKLGDNKGYRKVIGSKYSLTCQMKVKFALKTGESVE